MTVGQTESLLRVIRDQIAYGHIECDISQIDFLEVTDAQRAKLWALIYNKKFSELQDMLFSLGAKI